MGKSYYKKHNQMKETTKPTNVASSLNEEKVEEDIFSKPAEAKPKTKSSLEKLNKPVVGKLSIKEKRSKAVSIIQEAKMVFHEQFKAIIKKNTIPQNDVNKILTETYLVKSNEVKNTILNTIDLLYQNKIKDTQKSEIVKLFYERGLKSGEVNVPMKEVAIAEGVIVDLEKCTSAVSDLLKEKKLTNASTYVKA